MYTHYKIVSSLSLHEKKNRFILIWNCVVVVALFFCDDDDNVGKIATKME